MRKQKYEKKRKRKLIKELMKIKNKVYLDRKKERIKIDEISWKKIKFKIKIKS